MAYNVLISLEAQQDIDKAILWYEAQQSGLGIRFYTELLSRLEKLEHHPEYYSFIYEDYRHAILHAFPFHIIFKIRITASVFVIAVWHTSKDTGNLFKRMK